MLFMSNEKTTLLVVVPGREQMTDAQFHLIVAGTGEHLASHICSHYGYAMGDLYYNREQLVDDCNKRFGNVELKFIEDTGISNEELLRRNKEWYNKLSDEER